MADAEKKKKPEVKFKNKYLDVRQVTGQSDVSFADAVKNAINGLYLDFDNHVIQEPPMSFEVVQLGGTITPNPGKINYAATLNVTHGGGS